MQTLEAVKIAVSIFVCASGVIQLYDARASLAYGFSISYTR